MMTLDECIKHEEGVADGFRHLFKADDSDVDVDGCYKLAAEYTQIASWLKELKTRREKSEPKLVLYESDGDVDGYPVYDMARCPTCDHLYFDDDDNWEEPYCMKCGQFLDWGIKE